MTSRAPGAKSQDRSRAKAVTNAPAGLPSAPQAPALGQRGLGRYLPPGIKIALAATLAMFALRLWISQRVGFGDAEALYAAYALHVQPAYLDHPGLIGSVARLLGAGGAPTPATSHVFSSLISSLLPWLGAWAALGLGGERKGALVSVCALMFMPEISVGLFGFTPDLLLAPLWLLAIGASARALSAAPGSTRSLVFSLLVGACLGLGVLSKLSMLLLAIALGCAWLSPAGRAHLKTLAPWGALITSLILVWPLLAWESSQGWPMLEHRMIATQGASGFSLRNLGALVGGQVLYVTPPFLLGAYYVIRRARPSSAGPGWALIFWATWVPLVPLCLLCLWSKVAEPHWLGPVYLTLALGASLAPEALSQRLRGSAVGLGAFAFLLGALWVGTDLPPKLLGASYQARYDLANDMHAWQTGLKVTREALAEATQRGSSSAPVVVGPHWVICAQLAAGLQRAAAVGCRTPHGDDFGRWLPEQDWWATPRILYVTDDRFETDVSMRNLAAEFPNRRAVSRRRATILRGGKVVRRIEFTLLELDSAVGYGRSGSAAAASQRSLATSPPSQETTQTSPSLPFGNTAPPLWCSVSRALRTNVSRWAAPGTWSALSAASSASSSGSREITER